MERKWNQGFTLLELLVVVIIVGILAAIALPQFGKATEKARQSEAMNILGAIRTAELIYYQENATFTTTASTLAVDVPADASSEHFFTYSIPSASAADFTARATRKITGGKTPPFSAAYTIDINRAGTISKTGGAP